MALTARKSLKSISGLTLVFAGLLGGVASAHVVVKPAEAQTAAYQQFTVGVPTEGDSPTVKLRLVVPGNIDHVTPDVKPGWTIDTVKEGQGEEAVVKEIIWSGGNVPVGQRDDFEFTAQMPADKTSLQWKAYQTYADGRVVSWDQSPKPAAKGHGDGPSDKGPYSETKVVDKLSGGSDSATAAANTGSDDSEGSGRTNTALGIAAVALVFSVIAMTQNRAPKTAKAGKSKK